MKLKIQKTTETNKEIPINTPASKIEQIKSELVSCTTSPELCEAEVVDMWDEIDAKTQ